MDGKPNIVHIQNWFQYTKYTYDELQKIGDRILDRYNYVAPPEILQTIHYLINNSAFAGKGLKLISVAKDVDSQEGFRRLPMLKCYTLFPSDKDYAEIQNLLKWCKEHREIISEKEKDKKQETVIILNPQQKPSSIISIEKLQNKDYLKMPVLKFDERPPIEG